MTIPSRVRVTRVGGALARFSGHVSVTLPNFGIMRAGNRGLSPTRRWFRCGTFPVPIAPTIAVKFSTARGQKGRVLVAEPFAKVTGSDGLYIIHVHACVHDL